MTKLYLSLSLIAHSVSVFPRSVTHLNWVWVSPWRSSDLQSYIETSMASQQNTTSRYGHALLDTIIVSNS